MDKKTSSVALIVLAAFLWGSSFPAIKVTLGAAENQVSFSFIVSVVRLSVSAAVGLGAMVALGRLDSKVFRQPVVWVLGLLNALSYILQHAALAWTTASKTSLLINFNIVFVAVLSYIFFRERLGSRKIAGVLLGISGVVILETGLDPGFISRGEFPGDILALVAGLSWSLYIIYTKRAVDSGKDYVDLSVAVIVATLPFLLLPLPLAELSQPIGTIGWVGILYLGIVTTLPPLVMWSKALKNLTATVSSILLLLEVLFAVLISIVAIGERFLEVYVLGGALVLFGGILATWSQNENRRRGQPHRAESLGEDVTPP